MSDMTSPSFSPRLLIGLTALALSSACAPAALTDPGTIGADGGGGGGADGGGESINPFDGDAQAILDGKQLYDDNGCKNCHGDDGRSATFKDLLVSATDSTEQQIFDAMKDGVPGTAMVSYSSTLSDDDIWKITSWVTSLADDGGGGGVTNPFEGDATEATAGKVVYDANGCTNCHGADGKSTSFKDLSVSATAASNEVLFDAIAVGVPGTAMVAYGSQIDEDDTWRIVTWIRTIE